MGLIKDFRAFRKKGISLKDPVLSQIFGGNSATQLTHPYNQIAVVYAAIRAKAVNVSQVPFKIYPKDGEEEITTGPIVDLFNNVNPNSSKFQLWEAVVTLLDNTGEGAVIIDSEVAGGVPVALWPTNRANMDEARQGGAFTGWNVKMNGTTVFVPKDQVIFNKYYNPFDQIRGLSPIGALRQDLDSEWGAVQYNKSFFEKGTTVGAVYSTDDQLHDEQYKRLKHELIAARQGQTGMHEALLLDGGVKLSNVRPSNKDLEFLELRKFTREQVAMVFKVPKPELSLYEDVNFATSLSADIGFWKKTLIPLMRSIQEQFNTDFLYALGFRGEFDVSAIDVLNAEILEKAEAAEKFYKLGYSRDEINARLNLGFVTESEDIRVNDLIPLPETDKGIIKALQITGELPKEMSQAEILKGMRDAKWKSLMNPVLPLMGKAAKNVRNYYFDVEQRLLRKANKHFSGAVIKAVDDLDLEWVDEAFSDQKMQKALDPVIRDSVLLGVGTNELPEESILNMIASRGSKITGINENAKETVLRGLRKTLDQAIREGWTEQERADAINASLKETMGFNKKNARTIARTETHGAYEEGRYEGIKSTNPTGKMWLSSRDSEVRTDPFNHDIDGEKVAFDETFSNGLQFPLDPEGEAGNVINCRCTWVATYEE